MTTTGDLVPREDWLLAARCHAMAVERYGDLCMNIMRAIAEGEGLLFVLDLVATDMDNCDHVDEESLALYKRARARAAGS